MFLRELERAGNAFLLTCAAAFYRLTVTFLFWLATKNDGTLEHLEHFQIINDLPHRNMEQNLEHWNIKDLAHVPRRIKDLQRWGINLARITIQVGLASCST